jgi:hypothetical protein
MRLTPIRAALAAAALLLIGALVWWALRPTAPPPSPPHPLSQIPSASVTAVAADARAVAAGDPVFRAAAALPARLAARRPGQGAAINWAGARQYRLQTAPGIVVWLQLVAAPHGAWARVNADALPGAPAAARQQAASIKRLRTRAYKVSAQEAAPLLQAGS